MAGGLTWGNFPTFRWLDLYGSILAPEEGQSRYRPQASPYQPIAEVAPHMLAVEDAPMAAASRGAAPRADFWHRVDSPSGVATDEGWVQYDDDGGQSDGQRAPTQRTPRFARQQARPRSGAPEAADDLVIVSSDEESASLDW